MKELTKEQIQKINSECPYGQGIFNEPFGIPNEIKGLVIYFSWESGGKTGSCWDDENTINECYSRERIKNEVLNLILLELKPDITLEEEMKIDGLFKSNKEIEYGYYGDHTENTIEWLPLSDLYKTLNI